MSAANFSRKQSSERSFDNNSPVAIWQNEWKHTNKSTAKRNQAESKQFKQSKYCWHRSEHKAQRQAELVFVQLLLVLMSLSFLEFINGHRLVTDIVPLSQLLRFYYNWNWNLKSNFFSVHCEMWGISNIKTSGCAVCTSTRLKKKEFCPAPIIESTDVLAP